jgi:hypothetical protein
MKEIEILALLLLFLIKLLLLELRKKGGGRGKDHFLGQHRESKRGKMERKKTNLLLLR